MKGIPSFWVDSAARIDVAGNRIIHKLAHGELVETANWLAEGPLVVGVTSGGERRGGSGGMWEGCWAAFRSGCGTLWAGQGRAAAAVQGRVPTRAWWVGPTPWLGQLCVVGDV